MTVTSGQLSVGSKKPGAKRMSGRIFLWLLATILLSTVAVAETQQAKKVFRIGYLAPFDSARESARAEAIRLALRDRAISKDKTSPSSTDMRKESSTGSLSLRPTSCV